MKQFNKFIHRQIALTFPRNVHLLLANSLNIRYTLRTVLETWKKQKESLSVHSKLEYLYRLSKKPPRSNKRICIRRRGRESVSFAESFWGFFERRQSIRSNRSWSSSLRTAQIQLWRTIRCSNTWKPFPSSIPKPAWRARCLYPCLQPPENAN